MDKEKLLAPRHDTGSGLPEDDVDLPGGGSVRVRGLSRVEAIDVQGITALGAKERRILHYGMIDPALTEAEAGQWQKTSVAGEIEPVSDKITELSGLLATSEKAAVQSFRDEPGS